MTLTKIRKRDGRLAEFNEVKIARAIEKAFNATYKPGRGEEARKLRSINHQQYKRVHRLLANRRYS